MTLGSQDRNETRFEPKLFKNYNLTLAEQDKLDKFLKENLKKGYIWKSESPMTSPFFFVKKKDGKLRPCQDYQFLNEWTIKNAYLLPLISKIMDKLKGAKYFMKLDVQWEVFTLSHVYWLVLSGTEVTFSHQKIRFT